MSLAPSAAQADIVLQVTTNHWEVIYGSLAWMSYHPTLVVHAKLMDTRTNKVLSGSTCNYLKAITKTRGYEEILANKGALLKVDLNQMAAKCARDIIAKAF